MVDRIGGHVEQLRKMGKSLGGAVDAFNGAVGNLETRVMPSARRVSAMVPEGRPPAEVPEVGSRPQVSRLEAAAPEEAA